MNIPTIKRIILIAINITIGLGIKATIEVEREILVNT
jgi:hypothetical protein